MGRPLETEGVRLDKSIRVPCAEGMLRYIDQHRGKRSRAKYIRDLVKQDRLEKGQDIK